MRQIKSEQKKTSSQKYSRISGYEMENQNYLFKKIKLNNKPRVRKISEETEDQNQTWKEGMMSEIISSKRKIKKDRETLWCFEWKCQLIYLILNH